MKERDHLIAVSSILDYLFAIGFRLKIKSLLLLILLLHRMEEKNETEPLNQWH
jgi:hypothetical protein